MQKIKLKSRATLATAAFAAAVLGCAAATFAAPKASVSDNAAIFSGAHSASGTITTVVYNPPPPFPVLINPAAASGTLTLSATPLIPVITAGALTSGTILISDSTPIPLSASANLEGTVNGSDFSILAANFGKGLTNWDEGNFLYGSSVNGSDFSALAANFGQGSTTLIAAATAPVAASTDGFIVTVGSPSPAASQVPEPVSAAIFLCGMGAIGMRRKINRGKV